jgi:hypothetical protein
MEVPNVKTTLLLATTLFLVSAPAPDSNDIAEMTSNFIILEENPGLMADEGNTAPVAEIPGSGPEASAEASIPELQQSKATEPETGSGPGQN